MRLITLTDHEKRCLEAIIMLRECRERLLLARAPRAADKVRLALKSAEGALRNARGKGLQYKQAQAIEAFRRQYAASR